MTNEEWLHLDEEYFKKDVKLGRVLALVPWIVHGLPAEARDAIFAAPGGRVYQLMLALTRRGFERRHRAAFAYVD